ncbi:MAG: DUF3035 domain-containing protein [Rhodospirillaceae bacterium]|nr:DUF3035 domain-containing protein [Rhodospirillaceae bacterium]
MPKFRHLLTVAAAGLALAGCEDTKRALGIEKSVPDEFAVVSRAPLVMPPDFNLRPPAPGAERPQEGTSEEQAMTAVFGRDRAARLKARGFSEGEVAFLDLAGASTASPDIRRTIDRETSAFAAEEKSFTDRLIFWSETTPPDSTPIDPVAEQKRLSENQALGKKPNDGPIPVIRKGGKVLGVF